MKIITNEKRKTEIETRLTELFETGKKTEGFYFNIGDQEFMYEGSWEDFGKLMKEGLPFKSLVTTGEMFTEPLLARQFSKLVYTLDSKSFPISAIDITPRLVYAPEVAAEIRKLQKEYQSLVGESGVMGS
jgi:hypothetical protein